MKKVYVCNDSVTGIFSAIYEAWKTKLLEEQVGIAIKGRMEQEFFCEYIEVEETEKKAIAVERLIRQHLGEQAYQCIYYAILAEDAKKGDAVLGAMLEAKRIPDSHRIMEHLSHPKVGRVFELSRKVSNEAHYYIEFVRFAELENGVLFSEIEPKAEVLSCLGDHFANRFPLENWMIYDKTHRTFLIHEKGKQWMLAVDVELNRDISGRLSASERLYVKLWKGFFENISIRERESYERQRQHLPLHFREHMTEFEE